MFLDSNDFSENERDSVSVRSINMDYNEPQAQLNFAFDENFRIPKVNAKDIVNVNVENEEPGAQVNRGFEEDSAVNGYVNNIDHLTIF